MQCHWSSDFHLQTQACTWMIRLAICRNQLQYGDNNGAPSSNGICVSVCVSYDEANVWNMLCRCSKTLLNKWLHHRERVILGLVLLKAQCSVDCDSLRLINKDSVHVITKTHKTIWAQTLKTIKWLEVDIALLSPIVHKHTNTKSK